MEPMADIRIAARAAQQHGVFSAAQALAAGMSRDAMRHRVVSGRWGRVHRGVFRIAGSAPTSDQALTAAWLAAGDGAVVSHRTAARLAGFPLRSDAVELTVASTATRVRRGLIVHRTSSLSPADRATYGNVVATSPTRTLIDLAGVLRGPHLVACVDAAASKRLTTPAYLRRRMAALGRNGRRGIPILEAVLDERFPLDRAPESPLERSVVDLLLDLPGDRPVLQYEVRLPDGRVVRLDIAWPLERLALEADSYEFHSAKAAWAMDHTKRAVLVAMGWRILPVTDFDVCERPEWIVELVAPARGLVGTPAR